LAKADGDEALFDDALNTNYSAVEILDDEALLIIALEPVVTAAKASARICE